MTGTHLLEEGRRLARPCVHLRTAGENYAAIWQGRGPINPPEGSSHWISIDTQFLKGFTSLPQGILSVFLSESKDPAVTIVLTAGQDLPKSSDGERLYAHPSSSLPPIDAVFKFGSSAVKEWLKANNWEPDWSYNDNFKDQVVAQAYERSYQDQSPLYTNSAHAVLGGWHMPWPDGDWEDLVNQQLLVWTIAGSEPWIEVWETQGTIRGIERIT